MPQHAERRLDGPCRTWFEHQVAAVCFGEGPNVRTLPEVERPEDFALSVDCFFASSSWVVRSRALSNSDAGLLARRPDCPVDFERPCVPAAAYFERHAASSFSSAMASKKISPLRSRNGTSWARQNRSSFRRVVGIDFATSSTGV